tara:strand:+ start:221 stop:718 length:498 start_codon:yes stop_codon:yes gene_type:complete
MFLLKEKLLLQSLHIFFNNIDNQRKILIVLNSKTKVSLRLLDWFVTNYAKHNSITICDKINKSKKKYCFVHLEYKAQLKAYSKKNFDPFCRRNRIHFYFSNDRFIETTVGQLNFFKWAIQHKIIDYLSENVKEIENDMNSVNNNKKAKKKIANKHDNLRIVLTFK